VRILLVQPEYVTKGIGFRMAALTEPLQLEMLAALVPDHDVRILDLRLEANLLGALTEFQPDMVGVTALTTEVYAAVDVLRRAKAFSPEIFTVAGGHHATLLPNDFLVAGVDAVVLGDAEVVFPPLVAAVAGRSDLAHVPNLLWRDRDGRFVRNAFVESATDMDTLPIPRRDLTAAYRAHYFFGFAQPATSVVTARGCPYRCNFCSVWEYHHGHTRKMTAERVVRELATVGTKNVTFVDDNFLIDHRRESEIADRIEAEGLQLTFGMECRTDSIVRHPDLIEKWVKIGLLGVFLGLEGASDRALRNVNKRNTLEVNDRAIEILHEHGLSIWGAFIVDPDWEEDDFRRLRDYVDAKRIPIAQFTVLTPLPGTELYRQRFRELLTTDYTCFDAMHAVVPTRLPREAFYRNFAALYRQTSLEPYYDLVRMGRLTIEQLRRGKTALDSMVQWERYVEHDPVLGHRRAAQPLALPADPPS
jgi:radical SAM superfamily enzyme YgiQ (UPF0313 family)